MNEHWKEVLNKELERLKKDLEVATFESEKETIKGLIVNTEELLRDIDSWPRKTGDIVERDGSKYVHVEYDVECPLTYSALCRAYHRTNVELRKLMVHGPNDPKEFRFPTKELNFYDMVDEWVTGTIEEKRLLKERWHEKTGEPIE